MAIPIQPVTDEQRSAPVTASPAAPPGPARQRGTRSRAGNAMGRARQAALRGTVLAVAKYGSRKATMGDIAMLAGIAKATLYNHFRARDDVYRAAVLAEIERIAAAAIERRAGGVEAILSEAAGLIAEHPALRRIAADEPATLARLAASGSGSGWDVVRAHVAAVVRDAGATGDAGATRDAGQGEMAVVGLIVRYFASLMLAPGSAFERAESARVLAAACAR